MRSLSGPALLDRKPYGECMIFCFSQPFNGSSPLKGSAEPDCSLAKMTGDAPVWQTPIGFGNFMQFLISQE